MAAVQLHGNYRTFVTALAGTSKTPVYTVGDDEEIWADVTGISICDSTGLVNSGAIIHATIGTGYTERVLAYPKEDEIDNLYTLEGLPLHLDIGGSIAVTGASGHHVWVTIVKGERVDNRARIHGNLGNITMGWFENTSTQSSAPWKPAQKFLRRGMQQALQLYNRNKGFNPYTKDRVADVTPATQQAYGGIMSTAAGDTSGQQGMAANMNILSGGMDLSPQRYEELYGQVPGMVAGQVARYQGLSDEVAGTQYGQRARYEKMLNETGNPYFENVINKQAGDLTGDISNQFSMGGRYGGAAHTGAIASQVGDFRNKMASENWYDNINAQRGLLSDLTGMERGFYGDRSGLAGQMGAAEQWGMGAQTGLAGNINQVQQQNIANRFAAMGQIPSLQDAMYDPYGRMASVGTSQQAQEQAEIEGRMARYNEGQQSKWNRLGAMMGAGGQAATQGGTTTTTEELDPWAMLLGTGMTAANMWMNKGVPA